VVPQFTIKFTFKDLEYSAEVKAIPFEGRTKFDVYYSLTPLTGPAVHTIIFSSKGTKGMYWRQQVGKKNTILESPAFINAIGEAIEKKYS
jgi:hypothetical protein